MPVDQYGDETFSNFRGPARGAFQRAYKRDRGTTNQQLFGEADQYRSALEKAAYGGAGREFSQGLSAIQNQLAGAGPLADSGAATALRARLLSGVYGRAQDRIQGGFADYLRQALNARQQYRYQQMLQKSAKPGALETLAGFAGGFIPSFIPRGGGRGSNPSRATDPDLYYGSGD